MGEIMVSIICNTYNHGKYIRYALESFITQKTTFPFEVIVHDDASTDETVEIIREYEKQYPELIKPIYETENQYSKGVKVTLNVSLKMARGKYFAFCEGDDYWIDEYKLQKQFDYMENHENCTLCIHNALQVSKDGKIVGKVITSETNKQFSCEEVIKRGGGFCVTNSIFAPMRVIDDIYDGIVRFALDYFWQIYLASQGDVYCIAEEMSAYRVNTEGSWTQRIEKNADKMIKHRQKVIDNLHFFNEFTHKKYDEATRYAITKCEFKNIVLQRDKEKFNQTIYKEYYKKLPRKEKIKSLLSIYCKWILDLFLLLKGN